ncbi:oxygenase MpaB family protein [Massilia sp. IC2-477]|uniref:oxygenase MpaB family protein n=1 Tax=Massilia sp. IC2-477 TaxID=2887198 RepID=UPI001D0FC39B|nr:oxygenase MpaB family protein [Massilia sp. IC2-477]MCC2955171.1 oxygenase MpaB family protein [Massilia sp. IC2-477]
MLGTIRELMQPPPGMAFDFSQPAGEPALAPQGGVAWEVFANPVALFVGGVTAVLLELAEPAVRAGVWEHSSFRRDPVMRLRRTGAAAMMTVYGPRTEAEKLIARVVRMHGRVEGSTADGLAYRANDPQLLDWVHATAGFGFTEAYHRYVRHLSAAERDAAFAEGRPAALLYGATGAPRSWPEWEALLAATAPRLEGSDTLDEFLQTMTAAPIAPAPLRRLQSLLVRAAVEIVPEPVRALPQLRSRGLRPGEAVLVRALARTATLLPLGDTPPVQAARRLAALG